jgi:5'-3' exonuclease
MLVDARNCIYRAIYAGLSDQYFVKSKHDFAVIFFRFISTYLNKFKPNNVHFFWDPPKNTLWRKVIYPDYKEKREVKEGMDELLERNSKICAEILAAANCRNYKKKRQEADDLIFAFCRQYVGSKMLIISSDGDFRQIMYMMRNVDIYNPNSKDGSLTKMPEVDPVDERSLTGEKGDNIVGYPRIGPATAAKIIKDPSRRKKLYEDYGRKTYTRNRMLIDLTICPYLVKNLGYVTKVMAEDTYYDEDKIKAIIQKYKVRGLTGELRRTVLPFKFIGK